MNVNLSLLKIDDLQALNVNLACNTSGDITRENVMSAVSRGLPEIVPYEPHAHHAVLVGGGPSLRRFLPQLKHWQQNGTIFALNAAAGFLLENGIKPDYQVLVDPRADNVQILAPVERYLIASQCAPEVLDFLHDRDVTLFHLAASAMFLPNRTVLAGSVTVGLAAMCLVETMGYRKVHLYGYDSSYEDDHHAYPQAQTAQEATRIECWARDKNGELKSFQTNYVMAKQAEMFPEVCRLLINADCAIQVHGDGLLPTIAHAMRRD